MDDGYSRIFIINSLFLKTVKEIVYITINIRITAKADK